MTLHVHYITRGRKKRKRKPGAGTAVYVRRHRRTPRGPNRGKPMVIVDAYRRGRRSKNANTARNRRRKAARKGRRRK